MNLTQISRRKFLAATLLAAPCVLVADAKWIEPTWLKVKRLQLGGGTPKHRLVHFTDLHYKGDRAYAQSVVDAINLLSPDFVCFTGDLIEEATYQREALEILSGINAPLYGVPGNHDYWGKANFAEIGKSFAAGGGGFLLDEQRTVAGGKINLIGITCSHANQAALPLNPEVQNILLMHFPAWVKKLGNQKFDLILAGHSHGGQVRIPLYGPLITMYGVEEYDMGLYRTAAGPLYVNPGIGWFYCNIRFNCRPEITLIEI